MPPKKAKGGDSSEEQAVLAYLQKTNRPYSANDISSQLHGQVSPAQAKKVLNSLADEDRIRRKDNGKQQIFFAIQTIIDVPNVEEAEEEEDLIKERGEQADKLKEETRALASQLQELTSALTDDQIRERIAKLSHEIKTNEERLTQLRSGEVISPEERKEIETEHAAMLKLWSSRKRIFKNISDAVSEGYPGKMKDLFEELGVETDESSGADPTILGKK
ncbi:PSMC3 interacting protein [Coemansia sp. RSA 2337]|nr:PSMC3 interacting protein [Coemansia sp. S680]KAJ2026788.1 PSMC3 interacting protein [Coemansia sp. S3946]KAJ2049941.1 PSMC3 interacting protein [Coemansia sp. S2]KAJ2060332.1 PSMC3 interacting protein [Coemansia sp. S155-1]KAJ2096053.1 PSMC3 interacting protein [Coemansia sp. S100]KAJ2097770.1 PSMC3 interacting protein [Coemansia sp. S142-1]KAJ2345610.1 PSMC3 interacting protein [Coemansia sp. RSA 2673]KAJ2416930.1 PSMC3 interacting protein [Coemansia sp. RSA 2531]KAJ2461432.1 PSMC3 int